MSDVATGPTGAQTHARIRRKAVLDFGLFAIFFVFYMTAAIIQTPAGKGVASQVVFGMPFGLLISLLIFPLSWVLIVFWFWKGR